MAKPYYIRINPISPHSTGLAKYMGKKGLKAMTGIDCATNRNKRTSGVNGGSATFADDLVSSLIINKNNKFFAIEIWKPRRIGGGVE